MQDGSPLGDIFEHMDVKDNEQVGDFMFVFDDRPSLNAADC